MSSKCLVCCRTQERRGRSRVPASRMEREELRRDVEVRREVRAGVRGVCAFIVDC